MNVDFVGPDTGTRPEATPSAPKPPPLQGDAGPSRNPYEIAMKLNVGTDGQVDWVIARDLLVDGLIAEAGEGDVRIGPRRGFPGLVVIEMSSPSGQASFEVNPEAPHAKALAAGPGGAEHRHAVSPSSSWTTSVPCARLGQAEGADLLQARHRRRKRCFCSRRSTVVSWPRTASIPRSYRRPWHRASRRASRKSAETSTRT
ncbi:SsgA family sporulation/cell division regulator [Saccharopolyspora spinosa]|uniref:SsgA family sporulation/cell division regulator n=1 Tax=Saccharopolyspora spinosa TaxID=60894 RepID=UPI003B42EE2B